MHFPNIRKNRHMTDATGKKIEFILILLALMVLVLLSKKLEKYASGEIVKLAEKEKKSQVIVLDAGHGGSDPGKIGVHEEKEKEINLEIALKVEKMLKKKKIKVIMTRTDDQMLDDQSDAGQKVRDLRERVRKINGEKPVFAVSIHQNSYPDAGIHGAQVFYYRHSAESEQAAKTMQEALRAADIGNTRQAKANDTYYLLKRSEGVLNIVECGFLTNPQEAELLQTKEYQKRIAGAIKDGIVEYLQKL
mgnify:FL=1